MLDMESAEKKEQLTLDKKTALIHAVVSGQERSVWLRHMAFQPALVSSLRQETSHAKC